MGIGRAGRAGRGRGLPGAVLEAGLGDRSGHPGLLRQPRSRPRSQSGSSPHRPAVGPAVCGAVAQSAAATGGRQPGRADRGSPQGSAISPLLANMFMHYAFDAWMAREYPASRSSATATTWSSTAAARQQAQVLRAAIADGWRSAGWSSIRQDPHRVLQGLTNRRGSHEHTSFTFLGYAFRARLSRRKAGGYFFGFIPAVSDEAAQAYPARSPSLAAALAQWTDPQRPRTDINPVVRGWINYYGRFYRSVLIKVLGCVNAYPVRLKTMACAGPGAMA